ncbi:hypothetical protein C5167_008853 [Papaver somniferum]|uniref:HMG box domain-containing protein n=1 Tax=Papaver somniferum TaxID=3469 RepID=A0A4Y7JYQ0_PAPSO|nr:high mobility group B protein 14-like isoform X1 [Papaver somniferum]RZC65170.1 hypothetical protein C5167_008853 [Papaver somniferum]
MTKKPSKTKDFLSASAENPLKIAEKEKLLKPKSTEKKMTMRTRQSTRSAEITKPMSPKELKPKPKPKKKEDSKMPKKPPTAFFYFLEDFRKEYQKQNPDVKSMRDVGKACGEKWKIMSYEEKVQYYDIATEKRAAFDDAMTEYKKRKQENDEDQGSGDNYEELMY